MCKDVALEARNKKCFRSQILQLCLAEGIAATKLLELVDDLVWWNSRNPCCNCRPLHVWIWNYKQLPANHVFASHCTPAFASQTATHSYTPFKRHANPDTASPVWHKRTSTILELEYFLETAGMIAEILCMTKGRYTGVLSSTGLHVAKCDPKSFWVRPVHGS